MLSVGSIIKKHNKQNGKPSQNTTTAANKMDTNTNTIKSPSGTKHNVSNLYNLRQNSDSDDDSDEQPLLTDENHTTNNNTTTTKRSSPKKKNHLKNFSPTKLLHRKPSPPLQPHDLNSPSSPSPSSPSSSSDHHHTSLPNDPTDADSSVLSSSIDSSTLGDRGGGGGIRDPGGFPSVAVVMPQYGRSFGHDPYFQFNGGDVVGEDGNANGGDGGEVMEKGGGTEDGHVVTDNTVKHDDGDDGGKGGKLAAIQQLTANLNGIKLDTLWESESLADSDTEMSTLALSYATDSVRNKGCGPDIAGDSYDDDGDTDTETEEVGRYCVPGDIGSPCESPVPVSPLTVTGRKCSSFVEDADEVGSQGSSDSAVAGLHDVANCFDVDSPQSFFPSTTTDIDATTTSTHISTSTDPLHSPFATPIKPPSSPSTTTNPTSPTSYHAKLLLHRYEVDRNADALYLSQKEVVLSAHDRKTGLPVALKLMSDVEEFESELEGRRDVDPTYVLPVLRAMVDWDMGGRVGGGGGGGGGVFPVVGGVEVETIWGCEEELGGFVRELVRNTSDAGVELEGEDDDDDNDNNNLSAEARRSPRRSRPRRRQHRYSYPYLLCLEAYNATLADTLSRRSDCNVALARKITRDVVVALILLHTENKIHANLSVHSIVRVGDRWKVKDLSMSRTVGRCVDMKRCKIAYSPPEVATRVLEANGRLDDEGLSCVGETEYDLWSLGTVLYGLFLGTSLWNSDSHGYVSSDDLNSLARWSPQSFLRTAYLYFPPDGRSDDERAAIDLISKLLMPTADDRKANFEFGIVSVHQHEFLEDQPLEAESLVAFGERQAVMLRSETEHSRFAELTKSLTLEERWELNRSRDVLLTGLFETTDVHTPTSFVVLTEKLDPTGTGPTDGTGTPDDAATAYERRLEEGLRWIRLFEELGPSVRGSLDGDITSVGHFWGKIKKTFRITADYVYLYFIDDMTGEPVVPERRRRTGGDGGAGKPRYPLEIKVRSDLFPKLVPLMQVTMRSMALYHGVAGIARMFGCPRPNLTRSMRIGAQERTDALKNESSASPFGTTFANDVAKLRNNKEQFLKDNKSLRCMSIRVLIQFLYKKIGCDFAGLKRLADEDGRAIWTTIDDTKGMKEAIQNRAQERLCEERNLWDDSQDWQIRSLQVSLNAQMKKGTGLAESLEKVEGVKSIMEEDARRYREENRRLEKMLGEMGKKLEETEAVLEKEQNKMKLLWIKRSSTSKKKKLNRSKPFDESMHSVLHSEDEL